LPDGQIINYKNNNLTIHSLFNLPILLNSGIVQGVYPHRPQFFHKLYTFGYY